MEVLALVLAASLLAGIIVFVFSGEYRAKRSACAEMVFTRGLLEQLAQPLGLQLVELAALPESSIPAVPMLTGTYAGHRITIKPAYADSAAVSIEGTGFADMYPYRDPFMSVEIQPAPDRHWIVPDQPEHSWIKTTFVFWEKSNLEQRKGFLAALVPARKDAFAAVFGSERSPLRVVGLSLEPRLLSVAAEHVDAPKLKFEGYTIKVRTDPSDLRHIIDDLVAIAEALPSKPD